VYRFDLEGTAKPVKIVPKKAGIYDWWADSAGVVRAGMGNVSGRVSLWYRPGDSGDFRRVDRVKLGEDKDADNLLTQLRIAPGTDDGYVLSNKRDGRIALYHFNYATRTLGDQVFAAPAN